MLISLRSFARAVARCAPAVILTGASLAGLSPSRAGAQATGAVSVLHTFSVNGTEGTLPIMGPIKASDGNYYGVTDMGGDPLSGESGGGTVYKLTPDGQFSVLHTFLNNPLAEPAATTEGDEPYVLIQGKDGNLYGLCHGGGAVNETPAGGGTLFRLGLDGTYTKLYDFDTGDPTPGLFPVALVQGGDGNLYGLTRDGGTDGPEGGGTFFRFALDTNTWTLLYTFVGSPAGPGEEPQAQLIVGQDGNFYGVTTASGPDGAGSVFKATPGGSVTLLYGFPFSGSARGDYYPLVQAADGSLYGVSTQSGENGQGTIYHLNTDGSNFTVVHDFAGDDSDGGDPDSIILGSDGNLYGSTIAGPASSPDVNDGLGTYFQLTPGGTLTTLAVLHGANGGPARPFGNLLETSPDVFLGVSQTNNSDQSGDGTILQLTVTGGSVQPAFFGGEVALGNGVYYLAFPSGNPFGYYSFLSDPHYIYHDDLGYEYVFDANDGKSGVYLYDFASNDFFYTSPSFPFPYLYDFGLNSVVYYYPDPNNPGRYNTNGVRYFFVFNTGQIISK